MGDNEKYVPCIKRKYDKNMFRVRCCSYPVEGFWSGKHRLDMDTVSIMDKGTCMDDEIYDCHYYGRNTP